MNSCRQSEGPSYSSRGPQEQKSVFALSLRLNILLMKSGDTDGERKKTDKRRKKCLKKFENNDKNKGKEKQNGNIRSDSNVKGHVETKHKLQVILAEISGHNAVSSNHYTQAKTAYSVRICRYLHFTYLKISKNILRRVRQGVYA